MGKPHCDVIGEHGRCIWDAKYRITVTTAKDTWGMNVCEDCKDEELRHLRSYVQGVQKQAVLHSTCTPLYDGIARERARHEALFIDNSHVITWKEASMLIRRCRWTPLLCRERGIPFLAADRWREAIRIASMASLRTMTPAQFWERMRKLDPNRVAQVERNIF
jgi:hypothetical protein